MNTAIHELLPRLQKAIEQLKADFHLIPRERKALVSELTRFIQEKTRRGEDVLLNFICTHNSRRSHIAQLWAQAAAFYFNIPRVTAFSGGTEATAFNLRAVKAMQEAGFDIIVASSGNNPVYRVRFSSESQPVVTFSKKYNDKANPEKDFAAVMTCSHADEHCPMIPGASKRIGLTYDDPKDFDGTPQEELKYRERVMEIGRDILYAFSKVN